MTLTYKLDLDILPLYRHTEIQVCVLVRLVVKVVTDRQTHRHVTDVGCNNKHTHGCDLWQIIKMLHYFYTISHHLYLILFYCDNQNSPALF